MKKLLISIMIVLGGLMPVAVPIAVASAAPKDEVCKGIELTGGTCGSAADAELAVGSIIKLVISILSILVGVVSVIMIIIGGFKYITSTGDPASVNSAKNTILYAVIGLVIVAMAQVIVRFVLTKV